MSDNKEYNSKIETIEEAAIRLQAECYAPYEIIDSPEKYNFYKGFISAINWQNEHCYTEQEVLEIIKQIKLAFANNSNSEIIKNEILKIDFNNLLKIPPVK